MFVVSGLLQYILMLLINTLIFGVFYHLTFLSKITDIIKQTQKNLKYIEISVPNVYTPRLYYLRVVIK